MEKEFQVKVNTTANKLTLLVNSTQRVGIALGITLLPIISIGADLFDSFAKFIGDSFQN